MDLSSRVFASCPELNGACESLFSDTVSLLAGLAISNYDPSHRLL